MERQCGIMCGTVNNLKAFQLAPKCAKYSNFMTQKSSRKCEKIARG
jgi:hypothetical protein